MNPSTLIDWNAIVFTDGFSTTTPSNSFLANGADFSVPIFGSIVLIAAAIIGILVGGIVVAAIARATMSAVKKGLHKGRR